MTLQNYGLWHVTTEGDCEGRTVKDLGIHKGYLHDIAFNLAPSAYYGLQFKPVILAQQHDPSQVTKVNVSLSIGTGTWDVGGPSRVAYFKKMLAGHDVDVSPSDYYACVTLTKAMSKEELQEQTRKGALAKLTAEEKDVLGL